MEQLQILYQIRNDKQDELNKINYKINELKLEIQKNCLHTTLNKYRYFDGHSWSNEYICDTCNKNIYNIETTHIINIKY